MMIKFFILSIKWVYYIPTPPPPPQVRFYDDISEIIRKIYAYRAQHKGYGHPFTIYLVQRPKERGKNTWGKSSLEIGQGTKFEICFSKYLHLHFNELTELLLDEGLVEEIMNSMIMCWSVEPARRKKRDSLYLII